MRRLVRLWGGLGLVVALLSGCSGVAEKRATRVDQRSLARYEQSQAEAKMILVETKYEVAYGSAPRLLVTARVLQGAEAPFLRDHPSLKGRAELLDKRGRVLYSIGYRPLDYQQPKGKAMLSTAGPRLRLPWKNGVVAVRLLEPERALEAEASLLN